MCRCEDCGERFHEDECATHYERHPYGNGYATEEWASCPFCGGTDLSDCDDDDDDEEDEDE